MDYIDDCRAFKAIELYSQDAIKLIGHPEQNENEILNEKLIDFIYKIEMEIDFLKTIKLELSLDDEES